MSLPDEMMNCLKEAFTMFDKDMDGKVSYDELSEVLKKLKIEHNKDMIMDMVKKVDDNLDVSGKNVITKKY